MISQSKYPQESCALLFGEIKSDKKLMYNVVQVLEMENFVHSSIEFKIDEMELYSVVKREEGSGLSLLGIFHSHPDDAYLSNYDRRTITHIGKLYPNWIWIVFGNLSHALKAFILENSNHLVEIPIKESS